MKSKSADLFVTAYGLETLGTTLHTTHPGNPGYCTALETYPGVGVYVEFVSKRDGRTVSALVPWANVKGSIIDKGEPDEG